MSFILDIIKKILSIFSGKKKPSSNHLEEKKLKLVKSLEQIEKEKKELDNKISDKEIEDLFNKKGDS